MSLAVWLLRFFAPSNHSIRKSSPSSSRTTDSRIAMTSRIMNPRIFAIHSRVGQRKVPRPHASVFILPRSPSTSDPSLPPCRRSFISAKFFVYLSNPKSSSHGTGTYAFVFYGMPSPVRFLPYTSLRDLSFAAPIIF